MLPGKTLITTDTSLKVLKENYVKDFAECLRVDCYKNCNIEFIDDIDYVLEKFLAGEYDQQLIEIKNELGINMTEEHIKKCLELTEQPVTD